MDANLTGNMQTFGNKQKNQINKEVAKAGDEGQKKKFQSTQIGIIYEETSLLDSFHDESYLRFLAFI